MPTNRYTLIHGDARCMSEIKKNSVQLIVTSPPYWQIKDYGPENQIGYHHSYEDYINNLNLVWAETFRILETGCRLCVNIGDQYTRTAEYGRYKVIPIRTEIIKFCESIGYDYMGSIIWQKVSTTNTSGGGNVMGSYPFPRNGILKLDYEFILIFKKPGTAHTVKPEQKEKSALTNEEWKCYFSGHWKFPGARKKEHQARFPEELPRRLIKMFSFIGDIVLDPFIGSGTTMTAARNLNRDCIGYEINRKYIEGIKETLGREVELFTAENNNIEYTDKIKKLPHIFKDHNQIKKISNVKSVNTEQKKYFKVKKVISPVSFELNNGKIIELLGIRPIPSKKREALDFIETKVIGESVYYRLDKKHNGPQVYLYLKNKTFINAHLIKKGFATIDTNIDFRYKKRFISYLSSN
jgi:modification methylase